METRRKETEGWLFLPSASLAMASTLWNYEVSPAETVQEDSLYIYRNGYEGGNSPCFAATIQHFLLGSPLFYCTTDHKMHKWQQHLILASETLKMVTHQ